MRTQIVLASHVELPFIVIDDWREPCRSLADYLGSAVELWRLDGMDGAGRPKLLSLLDSIPREQCDLITPQAAWISGEAVTSAAHA